MSDTNPPNPRPVLKLKTAPRKPQPGVNTPLQSHGKLSQKPDAARVSRTPANATTERSGRSASGAGERTKADELMHRMQADMDALLTR